MENRLDLPKTPFKNPQEEIEHLRKIIQEKEKSLEHFGGSNENLKVANDIVSEYKRAPQASVITKENILSNEAIEDIVLKLLPETHDKTMLELVHLAKEKGIKNALSVVDKMSNFHIADDFHRFLVEYIKEGNSLGGIDPENKLGKSLHFTLYEILIPEEKKDVGDRRSLSEIISGMEQFYSGMLSVSSEKDKNWISLEIANQNFSEEVVFYVAVPEKSKHLFEKHILSIFSSAKLKEVVDDYNIFNEAGETVGSVASSEKNPIFPLKTYDHFDHDPLNVILSSFSKVNKEGEGAAIQLVWYPSGDKYNKLYLEALKKIQKGIPVKEAIDIRETVLGDFSKTFKETFFSSKKKEGDLKEEVDPSVLEEIKNKIDSPIVMCNLRLLASSRTKPEAEEILNSLESSFNQFQNTRGNSLKWNRKEKGKLRELVKSFTYRTFEKEENIPLNLKEATTLVHFHTKALSSSDTLRKSLTTSAPAPLDIPEIGMVLGLNKHRNSQVKVVISDDDRLRHFYCIGQTGTGKTTLLKNMIIQDIKNGNGVCMIDPHGSDVQSILANIPEDRYEDVIYFDPAYTERPMALNMMEYDERFPEQKTFVVNELFNIFRKLYGNVPEAMGPAFEQYFRNSALLVMDDPESGNTLVDVSRVLSDKYYRELKISKCKNPLVVQFWKNAEKTSGDQGLANYVQYVTNKFDVFLANEIMRPVVAQEKSSFNFRDIMDKKKILLVNLSKGRLGDINANLIGLILVGKILMAALSRADSFGTNLPPFYLYIDEFQNITTDSISTILSEARKYKLSLAMAHQFIAQLEDAIKDSVFGNVGSICSFRVGADDAEFLEKQFSPTFTAGDLMNLDNRNAYLKPLINGKPTKPFNIETLAPDEGNLSQVEDLKQLSYIRFGKNRSDVEKLILNKFKF